MKHYQLVLLILIALLGACAKPPVAQMEATELMVMRASEARADQHAPSEFQAAQTALRDARAAMESSNFDVAQKSLEFAKLHAQHALELTEENKQRLAKDAERQQQAKEAVQREALRAKTAKEAAAERVKREALAAKSDSPSTAKPTAPALAAHYQVGEGETLWTISAQATVYHDALLWPLLYQANRDQIKDPRQIFPGQSLSIRRDLTDKEREEARQKARESTIFPIHSTEKNPASSDH